MSKPTGFSLNDSLGYWVFRLNRAMYAALAARLAAHGVSPPEWTALNMCEGGDLTPVALAERMGVDRAAVSRVLDQLERKRLIRRLQHPTDRRSTLLALTRRGVELLPKLRQDSAATNADTLGLLSPLEAEELLSLIRRLGERLPNGLSFGLPHEEVGAGGEAGGEPT